MTRPKTSNDDLLQTLPLLKLCMARTHVPENGVEKIYATNDDERVMLGRIIDLGAIEHLQFKYEIIPCNVNQFRMTSHLNCEIHQTCVATLVPVKNIIDEQSSTRFVSERAFDELIAADEEEVLTGDNLERTIDGELEIGRVLYEQLCGAIPTYPRAPGAEFSDMPDTASLIEEKAEGPFAALAERKKRN